MMRGVDMKIVMMLASSDPEERRNVILKELMATQANSKNENEETGEPKI